MNAERSRELGAKSAHFIPLSDLLKRNHDDRVQHHLANLEGESITGDPSISATVDGGTNAKASKHAGQNKIAYDVQMMQAKQGLGSPPAPMRANKTEMQAKRHDAKGLAARSGKLQKTGQQVLGGSLPGKSLGATENQKAVGKRINVSNVNEPHVKGLDATGKTQALKTELEGANAAAASAKQKTSLTAAVAGGVLLANQREQDHRSQGGSEQSDNVSQSGDRGNQRSRRGQMRHGRPKESQVSTSGFKLRE